MLTFLSTESVPIICPWRMMGTQMKAMALPFGRAPVLLRKRLSFLTSGMISALPVLATVPVTPSPMP